MRTLNLTLTRKWFDLTLSGEKPFEYREAKQHWKNRLFHKDGTPKEFTLIKYTNGYGAHRPFILVKFGGVIEGIIGGRHIPKNEEPLEDGQEYYLIVNGPVVRYKEKFND